MGRKPKLTHHQRQEAIARREAGESLEDIGSKQKVFFLFRRPRSGKGTILRITTALVGRHNTRFPTIETLAGRFGLQGLIGSSVAQITDVNADSKPDVGRAASRINGISGRRRPGRTQGRHGLEWRHQRALRAGRKHAP